MGRDKALLLYRGATLLEHAIARARDVTPDVVLLSGPERRYEDFGLPVITDAVCGVGPLGGLYSALLSASIDKVERIFWLGVDLPLVPAGFLRRMMREVDECDVAMARTPRGTEPLCAAFQPPRSKASGARFSTDGSN